RVIVHRTALNTLYGRISLPAQVEQLEIVPTGIPPDMLLEGNLIRRIDQYVDDLADRVAGRLRPEEGQNEIGAFIDAPNRQSLPEILAMRRDMEASGRRIEQSAQPKRGVDRKSRQCLPGAPRFPLQYVVYEHSWQIDVLQKVVHRFAAAVRDDEEIGPYGRDDEVFVDLAVELECVAVGGFIGVIGGQCVGAGRPACTAGQPKCQRADRRQSCAPHTPTPRYRWLLYRKLRERPRRSWSASYCIII